MALELDKPRRLFTKTMLAVMLRTAPGISQVKGSGEAFCAPAFSGISSAPMTANFKQAWVAFWNPLPSVAYSKYPTCWHQSLVFLGLQVIDPEASVTVSSKAPTELSSSSELPKPCTKTK